jgi:hypothetical protein
LRCKLCLLFLLVVGCGNRNWVAPKAVLVVIAVGWWWWASFQFLGLSDFQGGGPIRAAASVRSGDGACRGVTGFSVSNLDLVAFLYFFSLELIHVTDSLEPPSLQPVLVFLTQESRLARRGSVQVLVSARCRKHEFASPCPVRAPAPALA